MYLSDFIEVPDYPEHWINKDGNEVHIKNMSNVYLNNLLRFCQHKIDKEDDFTGYFEHFFELFDNELTHRYKNNIVIERKKKVKKVIDTEGLPSKVKMRCGCGEIYFARKADLNRGWGLSHSKKCAFKVKKGLQHKGEIIQEI